MKIRILAAAALAAVLACSDGTGPVAGTLNVNLTSPNSGLDEAAIVRLSMPAPPRAIAAGNGLVLWGAPVTTPQAKVALTGTLSNGTILTLEVDDVNQVSQYSAVVEQVAPSALPHRVRLSVTGYSLTVTK